MEAIWCREMPPDPVTELPVIAAALARMTAIGGVCLTLSSTVAEMLRRGTVHLFDPAEYAHRGGAAPLGAGVGSYMLVSRDLITSYPDAAHRSGNVDSHGTPRPITLQQILAHEADHLRGQGHVDPDGYLTRHALACSDIR
ncbi:MAG: hypothetical protein ACRELE_03150 [Gemmatimonadales bacterium]